MMPETATQTADTNDAENADEYDRIRALTPEALEDALREAWPGIADQISIAAGERRLPLSLGDVISLGDESLTLINVS